MIFQYNAIVGDIQKKKFEPAMRRRISAVNLVNVHYPRMIKTLNTALSNCNELNSKSTRNPWKSVTTT